MGDERKPLWPWTVALLIGLAVLYVASFGPACWITSRTAAGASEVTAIYAPLTRGLARQNRISDALNWYATVGAKPRWRWVMHDVAADEVEFRWVRTSKLPPGGL